MTAVGQVDGKLQRQSAATCTTQKMGWINDTKQLQICKVDKGGKNC